MNIDTMNRENSGACVEGFNFDFSDCFTVNGISKVSPEFLNIEMVSTGTDFFIRSESDPQSAVFDVWMLLQVRQKRHYFGNPGFIIGAQ
ncbi:MAG: hypothetical protein BWX60_00677 [Candidatus Marinimicrobia bacterium ADurb.Bin030]|nr:MAG: hypothetical protein BWX60_00677 [Candidatus Marinimicrobia bacterium ADurb.Bin030]